MPGRCVLVRIESPVATPVVQPQITVIETIVSDVRKRLHQPDAFIGHSAPVGRPEPENGAPQRIDDIRQFKGNRRGGQRPSQARVRRKPTAPRR